MADFKCAGCGKQLRSGGNAAGHYKENPSCRTASHEKAGEQSRAYQRDVRSGKRVPIHKGPLGRATIMAQHVDGHDIVVLVDLEDKVRLEKHNWVVGVEGYCNTQVSEKSQTIGRVVLEVVDKPGVVRCLKGKLDARKESLRWVNLTDRPRKKSVYPDAKHGHPRYQDTGHTNGEVRIVREDRPRWVVYKVNRGGNEFEAFIGDTNQDCLNFLLDEATR